MADLHQDIKRVFICGVIIIMERIAPLKHCRLRLTQMKIVPNVSLFLQNCSLAKIIAKPPIIMSSMKETIVPPNL